MSSPKYSPRDFLRIKRAFGQPGLYAQWMPGEGLEYASLLRAAQLQHAYAVNIRERLQRRGVTKAEYADEAGMSYDRFVKILRGVAILRIEDIAIADLLLGGVSEFDVARNDAAAAEVRYRPNSRSGLAPAPNDWKMGAEGQPKRHFLEYGAG